MSTSRSIEQQRIKKGKWKISRRVAQKNEKEEKKKKKGAKRKKRVNFEQNRKIYINRERKK